MGWYYQKLREPQPHYCSPPCEDIDAEPGDIWECPECKEWWVVAKISRAGMLRFRKFTTNDTNPGRNV